MKTKTAIWVDFDGHKTAKYNPKAICRHGWLKIQAIKSRTEGIPFRLNYFSRDTVNCYLSITLIFEVFLFFHALIFWKCIFHVNFLKFYFSRVDILYIIFHVDFYEFSLFFTCWFFLAKKQHKNQNINDWFIWKRMLAGGIRVVPNWHLTGWYKGASLNAHPEWMRI